MGIPADQVVNQESVIHFKCSICIELVDDVRELRECRHIFCNQCITNWHTEKSFLGGTLVDCPDCRKPFAKEDIIKVSLF